MRIVSFLALSAIAMINRLVPKRRQLLLRAFPDIEDQTVAVLKWLSLHPESQYPVFLMVSGNEREVRVRLNLLLGSYARKIKILRKNSPNAIWAYWRSKYVFITHGIYGFLPVPQNQCVVNLWHGMPIKRIWRGLKGSSVPPCTWLLSTSEKYTDILAEASGFPRAMIPATGLPRNDLLFSNSDATNQFEQEIRTKAKRVIFFLPTYRQSNFGFITEDGVETGSALAMNEEDLVQFQAILASRQTRVLVKPHPMSVHYGRNQKIGDWLWIISDDWLHDRGLTLYEALGRTDAMITDVSSVYVDYLSLKRPIFFYFPDLAEYRRTRTFLLEPLKEWLAGPLCTNTGELFRSVVAFLDGEDNYVERRVHLATLLNAQTGPDSTSRLFSFLGLHKK